RLASSSLCRERHRPNLTLSDWRWLPPTAAEAHASKASLWGDWSERSVRSTEFSSHDLAFFGTARCAASPRIAQANEQVVVCALIVRASQRTEAVIRPWSSCS